MRNILITGGHGFVGSNLAKYLSEKEKYFLHGLDINIRTESNYNKEYTWENFNLEKYPEIEIIIHLAGKAHDTKNTTNADEYLKINLGLTKLIFDQFLRSKASKFIYFSSVKAVADSVKNEMLNEQDFPNPQTPYGQSKLEAEKYIFSKLLPEGKTVYIFRPAMIHGPGNKGNLNLLHNLINKGIPYPLGSFSNQRSFTSIGNLNFVIEQFINKDIESGIYQVADNETVSTTDIIKLIGEVIGKKTVIWNIPTSIVNGIAKMGDVLSLPLNSEKLKKLTENYVVSNQKLISALGAELPISAREGLKYTLSCFTTTTKF